MFLLFIFEYQEDDPIAPFRSLISINSFFNVYQTILMFPSKVWRKHFPSSLSLAVAFVTLNLTAQPQKKIGRLVHMKL